MRQGPLSLFQYEDLDICQRDSDPEKLVLQYHVIKLNINFNEKCLKDELFDMLEWNVNTGIITLYDFPYNIKYFCSFSILLSNQVKYKRVDPEYSYIDHMLVRNTKNRED